MKCDVFKKTTIRDGIGVNNYLVRWSWRLPLFGWSIKVHHIIRPDDDRCDHTHPWAFIRIILSGGYTETQSRTEFIEAQAEVHTAVRKTVTVEIKPWRPWAPWRVYVCGPEFTHRILRHRLDSGTWSLILCGRKTRLWGFWTKDGWMDWRKFLSIDPKNRTAWCEE